MRLFVRLFTSFWMITVILILVTLIVFESLRPRIDDFEQGISTLPEREYFMLLGTGMQIGATDGLPGLKRWIANWPRRIEATMWAINDENKDILDRRLPDNVRSISNQLSNNKTSINLIVKGSPILGRYIYSKSGAPIRLVIAGPVTAGAVFVETLSRSLWPILVIATIISATLCYTLARHLTTPIELLRQAASGMARGQFKHPAIEKLSDRADELGELARDFNTMSQKVENGMERQKRLIKDVSHELRTPLARIQIASAIARNKTGDEQDRFFDRIDGEIERLNDIIGQILSLPVLETEGEYPLDDTLELNSLLSIICQDFRIQTDVQDKHGIYFLGVDEDALVATSGMLLRNAIDNIINNAIRYTPAGGDIHVSLKRSQMAWEITVDDQGSGVPNEQLDDIFTPFFRVDESRTRTSGGFGLGLAIVRRIIDLHSGSITATNREEGGLRVTIQVPFISALDEEVC